MDVGGKEWGKWGIIPRVLLWMTEWVLGISGTWKVGRPWSYPNDGSCTEVAIKRETEFSTPSLFNASLHLLRMYYVPSFVLISMLHFLTKIETSRHRIFFFFCLKNQMAKACECGSRLIPQLHCESLHSTGVVFMQVRADAAGVQVRLAWPGWEWEKLRTLSGFVHLCFPWVQLHTPSWW